MKSWAWRLTALVLASATGSAWGQDKTAEAALRQLEERLEKAKSLSLRFQGTAQKGKDRDELQGSILVKEGNRLRYGLISRSLPGTELLVVSDGKKFRLSGPGLNIVRDVPKDFQERLSSVFTRLGTLGLYTALTIPDDVRKTYEIGDLQWGADDGALKVLTYTVSSKAPDGPKGIAVRLWIDPKSGAPVKRTMTYGPQGVESSESYEDFAIDREIADEPFALVPAVEQDKALLEIGNYPPPPANQKKLRAGVLEFRDATKSRVAGSAGDQFEALATLTQRFVLTPRAQLKPMLKEQNLDEVTDPLELAKPGKVRGVDYLVLGEVTRFALVMEKPRGALDRALGPASPVQVDTSKIKIASDIAVELKLVRTATGEIVSKQSGELKRELTAAAWGLRVLGVGGDPKNNIQVDGDSQGRLLRVALDDALKKMLPEIDGK